MHGIDENAILYVSFIISSHNPPFIHYPSILSSTTSIGALVYFAKELFMLKNGMNSKFDAKTFEKSLSFPKSAVISSKRFSNLTLVHFLFLSFSL